MAKIIKSSPAAYYQKALKPDWDSVNQMKVAVKFATSEAERAKRQVLGVTDVSCFRRFGVKGAGAADWLAAQGLKIPPDSNTSGQDNHTLVLRLGSTEFLLEDQLAGDTCIKLDARCQGNMPGVYKVARADAAFIISGDKVVSMLAELCKLDLSANVFTAQQVMMTQVADIAAIIAHQTINGGSVLRLWCDGTYGGYMWQVLLKLAAEHGGGAVGLATYVSNETEGKRS